MAEIEEWMMGLVAMHGVEDRLWDMYKSEGCSPVEKELHRMWNEAYSAFAEAVAKAAEEHGLDGASLRYAVQSAWSMEKTHRERMEKVLSNVKKAVVPQDEEKEGSE